MITPTLQSAATQFLKYFLQPMRRQSGGGPLSGEELALYVSQLGEELEITLGELRPYAGTVPECAGITVPVNEALFVYADLVQVTPGGPDGITLAHEPRAQLPFAAKYALRWIVERADIRVDGRDTIARVLADLHDTPGASTEAATPAGGPAQPSARAVAIAEALVAIDDRARYPFTIDEITSVPNGVDLALPLYLELLRDFFTFDSDGEYYAKWPGSSEGAFPAETTDRYKRLNVQSSGTLPSDNVFVIGNVPANFGLPGHADRDAREYREFIVEIRSDGDGQLSFDVKNSAVKVISIDGSPPRDLFDFCFFTVQ